MGHEDKLTIEELQEILNEEHQETQRNVSPEKEEDERGSMPTDGLYATGWTHRGHEQLVMEYEAILRGERSLMPKS
ncbi:hypothetical protein TNCV_4124911 [Trichonephila clavipes]|nr:hypothetical protein TNCV_4124911 [Trichonephila clavipes]